jgi:hypothetical protein
MEATWFLLKLHGREAMDMWHYGNIRRERWRKKVDAAATSNYVVKRLLTSQLLMLVDNNSHATLLQV